MPSAAASSAGRWRRALHTQLVLDASNMALGDASAEGRDPSLRPGLAVHLDRLRQALPRGRRAALDGIGRRCLRQRDGGELLRHARMRAARSAPVQDAGRGAHGRLRVHRGLLQSAPASFLASAISRRSPTRNASSIPPHAILPSCSRPSRRGLETTAPASPPQCRPTSTAARHDGRQRRAGRDEKMLSAEQKDRPKGGTMPSNLIP